MFFNNEKNQICRIKSKLETASKKDKALSVFGSSSHKYQVAKKLSKKELEEWENRNRIKLPTHFAQFLTEVGNGGAGPYYGIYSIEKLESYNEKNLLAVKSCLYPNMPKEEWNSLAEPLISDDDIDDSIYDSAREKLLGGMLCFGTQGCEYDMYIVLEGKYTGRIVYTADFYPDSPFFFTYEDNFLDWYERWLDEIILDYNTSWFGYKMPGDENKLIQVYQNADNEEEKSVALDAMIKFNKVSKSTLDFLKNIVEQKNAHSIEALQSVCRLAFDEGRGYALEMINSENDEDFLTVLRILNWYGRESNLDEFIKPITSRKISNSEILKFVGYILESQGKVTLDYYEPFLYHKDLQMRSAAIYATRNCTNKLDRIDIIEQMLADNDSKIMKDFVSFWELVPHERLLPYYKAAWWDYKSNDNFSVKFYNCLKELNLPSDYFDM